MSTRFWRPGRASARSLSPAFTAVATLALILARAGPGLGDAPAEDLVPAALIQVPSGAPRHVIVVEKATQTLRLYVSAENGLRLDRVLPCTTGKARGDKQVEGDLRTPEGLYWFTEYIAGQLLPPLYGAGAFVMSYPDHFDRLDGKTGSGIWLHGVESDDRVYVSNDTRGCVAVRNDHFEELRRVVRLRETPILVVEAIDFAEPEDVARRAADVQELLEDWRRAWRDADMERYMGFYSPDFTSDGKDRQAWERHKRAVADPTMQVALKNLFLVRLRDRAWLRCRQEYSSRTLEDVGLKTLWLRAPDDDPRSWRIVGEDWSPLREPFELIEPRAARPFTPAQVAAMAPDAAPSPPGRTLADEGASPRPPGEPDAASPSAPTGADDSQQPSRSPEEPGGTAARGTAESERPARVAPPPYLPAQPVALRHSVTSAALGPIRTTRETYLLHQPHARRSGDVVVLDVQLLNRQPSIARDGFSRWEAEVPGMGRLVVPSIPASPASLSSGEPFSVRQGKLLRAELPAAALAHGHLTVTMTIEDASGRPALVQDIIVGTAP